MARVDRMKFRMTGNCPYDERPDIGYKYDLIYIHSNDLAECIGSESTGSFYIIKDNKIVGSNKCGGTLQKTITWSTIPFLQLIHIGNLRVTKINKWGSHKNGFEYSIEGESELFDDPAYDGEQVGIWKKYVDDLIEKFQWTPHLKS
jgi:hypothetical protein